MIQVRSADGTPSDIRDCLVKLLLAVRKDALVAGANPLKHYDTIASRVRAAAGRSETVEQWISALLKGLNITSPSKSTSFEAASLASVGVIAGADVVLDLITDECGFLMALVRVEVQEAKNAV